MSKVLILTGSPSSSSRLDSVMRYAVQALQERGVEAELLPVRDLPAEALVRAQVQDAEIAAAIKKLEEADAVIAGTPVYKAAYTGILKAFLDLLPQKGLEHKVVLPIAIGGTLAHLLSIDYALKPVLGQLGPKRILDGMFVLESQTERHDDGSVTLHDEVIERLQKALNQLVGVLNREVSC